MNTIDYSEAIEQAFFEACDKAEKAEGHFVSLYVDAPYYGGPEEGGWWGSDTHLVATAAYPTKAQAEAAKAAADALAKELSDQARRDYGEFCNRQMDWLDARGLDADYLPEVDGESSYTVVVEDQPGVHARRGCRHYE